MARALWRWALLVLVAALGLQLFFILRIALMAVVDPASTSFQRSEAWRIVQANGQLRWRQQWVPYNRISDHLKRAVIASEDDGFVQHDGMDWAAIEKAWERNARAEERASTTARAGQAVRAVKVVGGSTITQQLAKNLLLSGERTIARKAQEAVLTVALEVFLSKRRILEIYLNSVEWGQGVFGAEAAAQHYFRKSAANLSAWEAARLAVMLPAPKRFEKLPNSAYLAGRSAVILGRMGGAVLP
uniref:Biosynthetic peptidoglycan transglycosylase n=1 Tax=uncultured bacterium A1Q1_fos_1050 TaxID=1256538 RepID=L7VU40_9BACT|nr:monofunctional biosynthetic peptidoglycan transglycosylase [uncultured bacterium A1Q1_fos_1050]